MRLLKRVLVMAGAIGIAGAAGAQLIPQVSIPNVGGAIGDVTSTIDRTAGDIVGPEGQATRQQLQQAARPNLARLSPEGWLTRAPAATLAELRQLRLAELVRSSGGLLEMAPGGAPVRRGRLVAIDPTPGQLRAAAAAGFGVTSDERDATLGIHVVVLTSPKGLDPRSAQRRLAAAVPGLAFDFDHVYEPAGGALAPAAAGALAATSLAAGRAPLIGMVDGGVASAPALARASIEQRGFSGAAQPTGHGTAVASLIVGSDGRFAGAAREARLAAADVFGGNPAAGTATSIVKALSWLAGKRPQVVNISLVGPRSQLIERAIAAMLARGIPVVAPVGNDGPAAPPLYPANQAGVIAVTAVDASNRAIREAGRAAQLGYAAPGADMAAALPGGGYARVRGTSFAAPFVAARLALTGSVGRLESELAKGRGRVGRGVICSQCRTPPGLVGAK